MGTVIRRIGKLIALIKSVKINSYAIKEVKFNFLSLLFNPIPIGGGGWNNPERFVFGIMKKWHGPKARAFATLTLF